MAELRRSLVVVLVAALAVACDRATSDDSAPPAAQTPAPEPVAAHERVATGAAAPSSSTRSSAGNGPDCRCEVWLADVLVDTPTPRPGVAIGPVVAVFGDSITAAVGLDGWSWVELLQRRRPDLEVRQLAVMGMTIVRAPSNNMIDHLAVGGPGRAQLEGVDTVIYMAGINDLNTPEADVDAAVDGFRRVRELLETAPVANFLLLPILPVGEVWATRIDGIGPGPQVLDWLAEFNRRVVEDGIATPFDPGFDMDGDGFGDDRIYDGFVNLEPEFAAEGGVDGVHPGPVGHEVLAASVDALLHEAATVGVANIGVGAAPRGG